MNERSDINHKILNEIRSDLNSYGLNYTDVSSFFRKTRRFQIKQKNAIKLIKKIMDEHGKKNLHMQISDLAKIELRIRKLSSKSRDHVIHAFLTFILGIYIKEKFLNLSRYKFQWKIAGLFHDVGYPIENGKYVMNPVINTLNDQKMELKINRPDLHFDINPVNFVELQNSNSLELIENQIRQWNLDIDVKEEYKQTFKSKKICHGVTSSLTVLYYLDCLYEYYNPNREYRYVPGNGSDWNQKYFDEDIVPACSAIFLHNLPERCFSTRKINRIDSPIAFLLKLSDSFQDWDRPCFFNKKPVYYAPESFDIEIDNRKLIFKIENTERREEIRNDIHNVLESTDIEII